MASLRETIINKIVALVETGNTDTEMTGIIDNERVAVAQTGTGDRTETDGEVETETALLEHHVHLV